MCHAVCRAKAGEGVGIQPPFLTPLPLAPTSPRCCEEVSHSPTTLPPPPQPSLPQFLGLFPAPTQAWMVAKSMAGLEWSAMKSWPSSADHSDLRRMCFVVQAGVEGRGR